MSDAISSISSSSLLGSSALSSFVSTYTQGIMQETAMMNAAAGNLSGQYQTEFGDQLSSSENGSEKDLVTFGDSSS